MAATNKISRTWVLFLAFLALVAAFGIMHTILRNESGPNLVLITMDTVRADRLHCYGYDEISTPNIDYFAANGVLFENAISAAPLTLPSHTTLLTGLYPTVHGVRGNTKYKLSDRALTLAEMLHENGYHTAAVVGAFVLHSSYGLDQGFDYYDDELQNKLVPFDSVLSPAESQKIRMREISERSASTVTRRAISWLTSTMDERDESFFLWIHYYDPHFPYNPPPPYSLKYSERPYDGEIAFVDYNIGIILKKLKSNDLLDRTLVVLAGDHGEGLGDHEEQTHSIFVYESTIRVPLIMSYPGRISGGLRVSSVVSLSDVVPTVLELLGIPRPTTLSGISLVELTEGGSYRERYIYSESMYPYLNYGWSDIKSLRSSRWKYIKAPIPELYDLDEDPAELNNLIHSETELADTLEARLDSILSESIADETGLAEDVDLSAQDRERLLALGYISGAPVNRDGSSLKDPKEMIQYHELMSVGVRAMEEGRFDEALEAFNKVKSGDPSNADVHNLAGMIYYIRNDTELARIEFKEAIKLNPDLTDAHHNLGNVYLHQENYPEAAFCYEKAVELDPGAGDYWTALGQIYAKMGDTERSEKAYEKALEVGYSSPQLLHAHALALMKAGRLEDSRESFEEALGANPGNSELFFEYGNLLERMNDPSEAISKYRQALSIDPELLQARYNIVRLLIRTGKDEEAIRELLAIVTKDPTQSDAHYLLGELYYRRGNRRSSKANFQRFLELGTTKKAAREHAEARLAELR